MKRIILKILIINLLIFKPIKTFDWEFYLKYNLKSETNKNMNDFPSVFRHFRNIGIKHNLRTSPYKIKNTNFDWKYYVKKNNLQNIKIKNKKEAYLHYEKIGFKKRLEYCKRFKIVISLHLYDLKLTQEFVNRINRFIKNNYLNKYYIIINIPIDDNAFKASLDQNSITSNSITSYLKSNLNIKNKNIHVIFSENRGQDIGGFFMTLERLKKINLKFDYLIKLHTKSNKEWRYILTSFLNIRINKLLNKYSCIYSCRITYPHNTKKEIQDLTKSLVSYFRLPQQNSFNFSGGTMFIVPEKFVIFFQRFNLLDLFKILRYGKPKSDGIEHAFERFFGYLMDYYNFRTITLDYYPPNYTDIYNLD